MAFSGLYSLSNGTNRFSDDPVRLSGGLTMLSDGHISAIMFSDGPTILSEGPVRLPNGPVALTWSYRLSYGAIRLPYMAI